MDVNQRNIINTNFERLLIQTETFPRLCTLCKWILKKCQPTEQKVQNVSLDVRRKEHANMMFEQVLTQMETYSWAGACPVYLFRKSYPTKHEFQTQLLSHLIILKNWRRLCRLLKYNTDLSKANNRHLILDKLYEAPISDDSSDELSSDFSDED
jgi:hypothetical protein